MAVGFYELCAFALANLAPLAQTFSISQRKIRNPTVVQLNNAIPT
jgi:hypothetical protein